MDKEAIIGFMVCYLLAIITLEKGYLSFSFFCSGLIFMYFGILGYIDNRTKKYKKEEHQE